MDNCSRLIILNRFRAIPLKMFCSKIIGVRFFPRVGPFNRLDRLKHRTKVIYKKCTAARNVPTLLSLKVYIMHRIISCYRVVTYCY